MHRGVPEHVAEHRGHDAQKEQVAPYDGPRQHLPVRAERPERKDREDRHESVEKDFPGDEDSGVAASEAFDHQRINHP